MLNDTSNYTQSPMLRNLQSSSQNNYMNIKSRIAQIFLYIKMMADQRCSDMTGAIPYMNQERIISEAFEIIIERIPSDNLVYNRSYIKSGNFQN